MHLLQRPQPDSVKGGAKERDLEREGKDPGGGRKNSVKDLKKGMNISVEYTKEGNKLIAELINVSLMPARRSFEN